jgi:hypothetical protein
MLIAKLKNKSILLILSRLVFTTSYSLLFNIVICIKIGTILESFLLEMK